MSRRATRGQARLVLGGAFAVLIGVVVIAYIKQSIPGVTAQVADMSAPAASREVSSSFLDAVNARPRATDGQVREIGVRLAEIQPEMASLKVGQIESRADNTCLDIWTDPGRDLAPRTQARFAGGDRPALTLEQAERIVAAVVDVYCH